VHDDEELKAMTTKSLTPCHRAFFCSNVASPNNTTTKSLAPCCHVFLCSNVGGPQGNDDKELDSSSSCIFLF
jgi:hypothetical protein